MRPTNVATDGANERERPVGVGVVEEVVDR